MPPCHLLPFSPQPCLPLSASSSCSAAHMEPQVSPQGWDAWGGYGSLGGGGWLGITCPCGPAWGTTALSPPVSPSGSTLMLCQAQMMCGNQFYDPQQHCCLKDTLVPLGDTRRCGSCSYRVCFEQCCDRWPPEQKEPLMVKLNVEDCSIPSPGDRLCQR